MIPSSRYNTRMTHTHTVRLTTKGEGDIRDLTPEVARAAEASGIQNGIAAVFVVGSTAAVTTIEFEPGLVEDLGRTLEQLAPRDAHHAHEARWHDDNGHSHIRASIIGPTVCVPVANGSLALGTWQQVVLCEFDTRPRERTVIVQVVGD